MKQVLDKHENYQFCSPDSATLKTRYDQARNTSPFRSKASADSFTRLPELTSPRDYSKSGLEKGYTSNPVHIWNNGRNSRCQTKSQY